MSTDLSKQVKLEFITGLVPREKSMAFERILFRATRGNVFLRQAVLEDPVTDPVSGEKVINCYFSDAREASEFYYFSVECLIFFSMPPFISDL